MTIPNLKGDVKLTLSSRLPQAKPVYRLNCLPENVYFIGQQYIRAQANIRPVHGARRTFKQARAIGAG
jgi:hypothetical protein